MCTHESQVLTCPSVHLNSLVSLRTFNTTLCGRDWFLMVHFLSYSHTSSQYFNELQSKYTQQFPPRLIFFFFLASANPEFGLDFFGLPLKKINHTFSSVCWGSYRPPVFRAPVQLCLFLAPSGSWAQTFVLMLKAAVAVQQTQRPRSNEVPGEPWARTDRTDFTLTHRVERGGEPRDLAGTWHWHRHS